MRFHPCSRFAALATLAAFTLYGAAHADPVDFPAARSAHPTRLTRIGPSPQPAPRDLAPPDGVEEVVYPSGALALKGWLATPRDGRPLHPAVVFLHGGFAFAQDDFDMARPFLDAGYTVFCPWMRAENGNPGHFELMFGEVDDALAAVRWIRARPGVDAAHVFLFGHSVGGGTAELTSLYPNRGVLLSGSAGGLYTPGAFPGWSQFAPFDTSDKTEDALRSLPANLSAMRGRHIAYIGDKDQPAGFVATVQGMARAASAPLTAVSVPGDHFSSVPAAMAAFIQAMKATR